MLQRRLVLLSDESISGLDHHLAARPPGEVVGLDNYSKYGPVEKSYQNHPRYRFVFGDAKNVDLMRELTEDEELQVLQRERKKRIEAIEAFENAGRDAQAEKEEAELDILEEFMPEPLGEDELERIVDDAIAENKATSMRDMGRVMADVMPQIAGRADGSAVSQLVREKLA